MKPIVAVIAPGMMGSVVANRLTDHGLDVRTILTNRSAATIARAKAAGANAADRSARAVQDRRLGEARERLGFVLCQHADGFQQRDQQLTGQHRCTVRPRPAACQHRQRRRSQLQPHEATRQAAAAPNWQQRPLVLRRQRCMRVT